MSQQEKNKALVQIHFCVLLWGFTAILGKLISLHALQLVWWRMLLVSIVLVLIPSVWRAFFRIPSRIRWIYAGIGIFVALHWLTFYASIKLSNASVGATCMALATPMTALIEPIITRQKLRWSEVALGVAIIPGVILVVGGLPSDMHLGVLVGAISAFLVAIFSSLNKHYIGHGHPLSVTAIELGAGTLFLALCLLAVSLVSGQPLQHAFQFPDQRDAFLLLLLALACTLLPFALSLFALRHLSAFTAQLAVNLEPVYAIVLAIVLLNEQHELTLQFYLGVSIILAMVFIHPIIQRRLQHNNA